VHESVVVNGPCDAAGRDSSYTCNSIEEHRQRIEFYTDLAAKEMFERNDGSAFCARAGPPGFPKYYFSLGILDARRLPDCEDGCALCSRKYAKLEEMQKTVHERDEFNQALMIAHIDTGMTYAAPEANVDAGAGLARARHEQIIVCLEGVDWNQQSGRKVSRLLDPAFDPCTPSE